MKVCTKRCLSCLSWGWIAGWMCRSSRNGKSPKEYPSFEKECRACGREVSIQPIVITAQYVDKGGFIRVRRGRPNRKDYRLILDQIDRRLAEGRVVYVSADGSNLRGILAGCYLARHGQTGDTALNVLQKRRETGVNGWNASRACPRRGSMCGNGRKGGEWNIDEYNLLPDHFA